METEKRRETLVWKLRGERPSKQYFLGRCPVRIYERTPSILSDVLRGLHQIVSKAVYRLRAAAARGNVRRFASQSRYYVAARCARCNMVSTLRDKATNIASRGSCEQSIHGFRLRHDLVLPHLLDLLFTIIKSSCVSDSAVK
jgi:hypothetical protein